VAVGVDLADDWPKVLVSQGFDSAKRAAWLIEGRLQYLDAPAALVEDRGWTATVTDTACPATNGNVGHTRRFRPMYPTLREATSSRLSRPEV
jgi:hypothetical protein